MEATGVYAEAQEESQGRATENTRKMRRLSRRKEETDQRQEVDMCLTNLQTSMPHLPPDRSASPAPGGPATVPGQERAGKAEGAGEARPGP